jgi:hypothetical protein
MGLRCGLKRWMAFQTWFQPSNKRPLSEPLIFAACQFRILSADERFKALASAHKAQHPTAQHSTLGGTA